MQKFLLSSNEIVRLTDVKGGCLVSNKITMDGEQVGYAYRELPDKNFPNDSGWRFLSGSEDESYLSEPANFNVFELNTICNYDKDILGIINGDIGEAYIREGDKFKKESQ